MTLDAIYKLPVQKAAALALGESGEAFVERSPWNAIEPNYTLDTFRLFGMRYFTKTEHIAPSVCAVTMLYVTYDFLSDNRPTQAQRDAVERIAYGSRPLLKRNVLRERRYFAAGPAKPVPLVPGAKPAPLSASALAPDSCDNPVSGRSLFAASSPAQAILVVTKIDRAVAMAKGDGVVPFLLSVKCAGSDTPCSGARKELARLSARNIWALQDVACSPVMPNRRCISVHLGPESEEFDTIATLELDDADGLWAVEISKARPPIA